MTNFSERLEAVIAYYKMSKSAFARQWGLNRENVHNYLTPGKNPDYANMEKFAASFPEINMDWMLTGKGNMVKYANEYSQFVNEPSQSYKEPKDYYTDKLVEDVRNMINHYNAFQNYITNLSKTVESYQAS